MTVTHEDLVMRLFDREQQEPGDVVAYLVPNVRVNQPVTNRLEGVRVLKDEHGGTRGRDHRIVSHEVNISGAFLGTEHTDLPEEHKSALRDLFGQEDVSARDQVNRVTWALKRKGGPYVVENLSEAQGSVRFDVGWHNRVEAWGEDDERAYETGRYPMLFVTEFLPVWRAGRDHVEDYSIKGVPGFTVTEEFQGASS